MALNPDLDPHGMPVPFAGEMMVLMRQGIEFHLDSLPSLGGKNWTARGVLYLTSVRMVFVASAPSAGVAAFDLPLLYVHGEKFNQPIFGCNNISARVLAVQTTGGSAPPVVHSFTLYFMEGGVGTFLPLFFNLLRGLRATNPAALAVLHEQTSRQSSVEREQQAAQPDGEPAGGQGQEQEERAREQGGDPLPAAPAERMLETIRNAYVDPHDPTVLYVQQPPSFSSSGLRRRSYRSPASE